MFWECDVLVSGGGLGFSGGALVALLGLRFPLLGAPALVWDLFLVLLGRRRVYHWPEMSMYIMFQPRFLSV